MIVAVFDPAVPKLHAPDALRSAATLPEGAWPPWSWLEIGRVRRLMWSAHTLPIAGLPPALAGLRILHLTDLHIDTVWMPAWDALLSRVRDDPPDLILVTGDFVEKKYDSRPAIPNLMRFLNGLTARLGVWGILGNHDGDVLALPLADTAVRLLCNELATLQTADATLEIVGILGVTRFDCTPRVRDSIPGKATGAVRLVMSHYPDQIGPLEALGADVYFTGHTHGGQVCLPGGIPLMTHDALPRRFVAGVHQVGPTWLVIGRGMSFSTYPIRVFCPADAIEITLA